MCAADVKSSKKRKLFSRLGGEWFLLAGILLNGFSLVMSFIYGHTIAGIILSVCELILIGAYILKII